MIDVDGKNRKKMSDMLTTLQNSRKNGDGPSHFTHTVTDVSLQRSNAKVRITEARSDACTVAAELETRPTASVEIAWIFPGEKNANSLAENVKFTKEKRAEDGQI